MSVLFEIIDFERLKRVLPGIFCENATAINKTAATNQRHCGTEFLITFKTYVNIERL